MQELRMTDVNIGTDEKKPIRFSHIRTVERPEYGGFHLHDCLEIYTYAAGEVDFLLGDQYYRLRAGDVLFSLPNELHRPVLRTETLYERFYVQIPVNAFADFSACRHRPLDRFLTADAADRVIRPDEPTRTRVLRLFSDIGAVAMTGGYLAYAHLLVLLDCLGEARPSAPSHDASSLVERALRYVSENIGSVSGVGEVAAALHVHPSYLSARFSRTMGTGLKQYITYQKISAAKELLAGGATVTETAYRLGFASSSHFIECFRTIVGVTPYRLTHRGS